MKLNTSSKIPYRLALDLGSTSIGWALFHLNADNEPNAIIKAGVRIFSDGRNPKDGTSLAVSRRMARGMRRRRDRYLARRNRMIRLLVQHGFFPQDELERKRIERLNPYELRAKGLDHALTPAEFARALFHINQRRGFKSNRKTDSKENEASTMKSAITDTRKDMEEHGYRTIGELLWNRAQQGKTVRARYREKRIQTDEGRNRIEKSYDLYIDRAMIEQEFDTLWAKQAEFTPALFSRKAHDDLKDCLLHQRRLRPVDPGRCTFLPEEKRAPLAMPSVQRFRIYQEVNNLRILSEDLQGRTLTLEERDLVADALGQNNKRSFDQLRRLLKLEGNPKFNLEDNKRKELKGHATAAQLSKKDYFGNAWHAFTLQQQDEIVLKIINEESESHLVTWLQEHTGVNEATAEKIANASLPEGYGSLSAKAIALILPELQKNVIPYSDAVLAAGFEHHSHISHAATGEILPCLPYYGEYLQRHVGFGSGKPEDTPEKRYGRIANPTVHIGLNQIRVVVNAIIARYGHPTQIVVEVARELKQSQKERDRINEEQAANQKRNDAYRADIAKVLNIPEYNVKYADVQKMILWHELNPNDQAERRCPYTGEQISLRMLLSPEVEIEHILPFARTLDDSMSNKTVSLRKANRLKAHRTPWEAKHIFKDQGWHYEDMTHRIMSMNKNKRYRFGENAMQLWQRDGKDFLARALNDTRYLSRIAYEYLGLICPDEVNTWVIPGQLTAKLRHYFGLNSILGIDDVKTRNDHRHHAVDACVIGVTDRATLQRFATANRQAQEKGLERLVDNMPLPWPSYYQQVQQAIASIKVSHKPDHGYERQMHNDTAYGLLDDGMVYVHKTNDNNRRTRIEEKLAVIKMTASQAQALQKDVSKPRHGTLPDGSPRPYKGYKGDSNYCIDIVQDDKGRWQGCVISTFEAYQYVRQNGEAAGRAKLLAAKECLRAQANGTFKPLVMRLIRNDCVKLEHEGKMQLMRVAKISSDGRIFFAPIHEANVDARVRIKELSYVSKTASSLQKAKGRKVTISPIGIVTDKGFKGYV